jgi:hypothetical protein
MNTTIPSENKASASKQSQHMQQSAPQDHAASTPPALKKYKQCIKTKTTHADV